MAGVMKAAAELAGDLSKSINEMEDDILSIVDFTNLLLGVTEGKEIEPFHVPGIYRLLNSMLEHGHSLRRRQDEARQTAHRLANP
jgi:hypothetical protein